MNRTIFRGLVALVVIAAAALFISNLSGSALALAPSSVPAPIVDEPLASAPGEVVAVFAGGCFWGIEEVYQHVKGVKSAVSGYAGGAIAAPTYRDVSSGGSGHAEVVRVVYDPSKVSYGTLLRVFFAVAHDPTQLNRQGPDVGTQYRSEIFYLSEAQKRIAMAYIDQLSKAKVFTRPIVTRVSSLPRFYQAEDYHQDYASKHPNDLYIRINDAPKVAHLKQDLKELYR